MKKTLLKPGYEFIFTLSLLAILGLPPLVFAQNKDVQITISNGDTTVNGKNINTLSAKDRKEAMSDIGNITSINNNTKPDGAMMASGDMAASGRTYRHYKYRKAGRDSTMAYNYKMNSDGGDDRKVEMKEWRLKHMDDNAMRGFGHKNTQNFSYSNTDSQGINTHVSFHVSEPTGSINHGADDNGNPQFDVLDLKDLTLVPEFEAGKTIISFSLPSKAAAVIQFKDSQNNIIWTDKAVNGTFSKAFNLGLNGVYYLHVKQGGKLAVKKILKD